MEKEKKIISVQLRKEGRGMTYAFLICLIFILIAGTLIWYDHDLAGTVLGTLDIIGLAAVFILGRKN